MNPALLENAIFNPSLAFDIMEGVRQCVISRKKLKAFQVNSRLLLLQLPIPSYSLLPDYFCIENTCFSRFSLPAATRFALIPQGRHHEGLLIILIEISERLTAASLINFIWIRLFIQLMILILIYELFTGLLRDGKPEMVLLQSSDQSRYHARKKCIIFPSYTVMESRFWWLPGEGLYKRLKIEINVHEVIAAWRLLYAGELLNSTKGKSSFCLWSRKNFIKSIDFSVKFFPLFSKRLFLNCLDCCTVVRYLVDHYFVQVFTPSQSLLNCNSLRSAALWIHCVNHFPILITKTQTRSEFSDVEEGSCSLPQLPRPLKYWFSKEFLSSILAVVGDLLRSIMFFFAKYFLQFY